MLVYAGEVAGSKSPRSARPLNFAARSVINLVTININQHFTTVNTTIVNVTIVIVTTVIVTTINTYKTLRC